MSNPDLYDCSASTLRILTGTYWSAQGWREPPSTPDSSAFKTAQAAGIMFAQDDESNHDEWVNRAHAAVQEATLPEVREAFIASLTSRRLDLRSALSSYIVARSLPAHSFQGNDDQTFCSVCEATRGGRTNLNVLNFERFKWGGVRKLQINYVAFDLEQFQRAPKLSPSPADMQMLHDILAFIRHCPPSTTASKLAQTLKALPGNMSERATFVDALSIIGILDTAKFPGFNNEFINSSARTPPDRHFTDNEYPACWWTAEDGINTSALRETLGLEL